MADESLGDVKGDAAEKDGEERDPFEVGEEAAEDRAFADAVAEDGEGDVSEDSEDEDDSEVDWCCVSTWMIRVMVVQRMGMHSFFVRLTAERINVVMVEKSVEETNEEVVEHGKNPRTTESVVGTDVSHDGDF